MGVQGLWSLLGPVARPTRLESLRNKRIAVDASIWIHQFMRTMRDNEGNELRNGHLLGFFRRICKLLFFDIKPIFVFDGGAPTLKRITIRDRRKRREGLQRNLKITARKILRTQLKCKLLLEKEKQLHGESITQKEVSLPVNKQPNDPYQLPPAPETNIKLDNRFSTDQELKSFVNEHIDIDSEQFHSLSTELQYELIQDLKIKSRQTSFHRVEQMAASDPLQFSKQQIELLQYRNQMMQRALQANHVSSGHVDTVTPVRVAGERGRQYVLYKNEDVSQGLGWRLPGTTVETPIELESSQKKDRQVPNDVYQPTEEITYQDTETADLISYQGLDQPMDQTPYVDPVERAIQSNPKLSALAFKLLNGGEEEEEDKENQTPYPETFEEVVAYPKVVEPTLMNDMRAYADDDEALSSVLSLIYQNGTENVSQPMAEQVEMEQEVIEEDELDLDAHQFYNLWVSRMPDAYVYLYSDENQHLRLIRDVIEEEDMDVLRDKLRSMRKKYGKTKETDEVSLDSYQFIIAFLKSVIEWNLRNFGSQSDEEFEQAYDESFLQVDQSNGHVLQGTDQNVNKESGVLKPIDDNMLQTMDQNIVLTDDDEDIQFVESNLEEEGEEYFEEEEEIQNNEEKQPYVLIDTRESLLKGEAHLSPTQEEEEVDSIDASSEQISIGLTDEPAPETNQDKGYNSEDELMEDEIEAEDEEYAKFISDISSKNLDHVRTELNNDMQQLYHQQKKDLGNSDQMTDQMVQDIQHLLQLFGVPYLVSPMEAEAQCAELEKLGLIDGTVTDDSDAFLFGSSRVYKNMFNQQRIVECYQRQDIEKEMALSRKKLIQLGFLLGTDYTEGIAGVGPVAAMEILREFSTEGEDEELQAPLKKFKEWYNGLEDKTSFQKKFRSKHDDLDIPEDFPNPLVIDAYYHPTVDKSEQKFEWGQPQLDSLRVFLTGAFSWSEEKVDQVLLPVLREMNSKKNNDNQATLDNYYNVKDTVSSAQKQHSSKRVRSVVEEWKSQKKSKSNGSH